MRKFTTRDKLRMTEKYKIHSLNEASKWNSENILTPITLSGVIVPRKMGFGEAKVSDYKLVCSSGLEYLLAADSEWQRTLEIYRWEEVRVIGLLNAASMFILPQKIFPRGPTEKSEKAVDFAIANRREFTKKVAKKISDLVVDAATTGISLAS